MARLPEDQIDQIKSSVSLLKLVESQGYKLTKQGKGHVVNCPFHDDKTPSCFINPDTNLFNCFGCGTGGSVIDWVMKTKGVSFRFACEILNKDIGVLENDKPVVRKHDSTTIINPLTAEADQQVLMYRVVDFYHATLKQSEEALSYLTARGLNDPELIDTFKLGLANRTLAYRLPEKNRKAGKEIRSQLQEIGILRETGHEHFNGSIVVPIYNDKAQVVEMYGRKINDGLRKGTPKHTYLPGPHAGIFNPACLESEEIILCESLIDAMTFWVHGFKNVTCSYGINGFTPSLLTAFKQHQVKRILIAYDRDESGNTAALELAEDLQKQGFECFRILFPKGMDANEYALKMSPAQKALALVIRKAEWVSGDRSTASQRSERPAGMLGWGDAPGMGTGEELSTEENENGEALEAEAEEEEVVKETIETLNPIDLAATPKPSKALDDARIDQTEHGLFISFGERVYRVRGHDRNSGYDQLKVQLLAQQDDMMHMDKLDLYSSKQRQVFINQACVELGVKDDIIKKDLGKVLLVLEDLQKKKNEPEKPKSVQMTDADKQDVLELLRDPSLLNRLLEDFKLAGVIGEETNKLVGYLSCVSRKLDKPLAVMIQSSSAAGKSSLMESILAMIPEEERVQYSAMTGQSLFYMGETNLKNKILAIAEEEGASNASYALKLLQSEGEVTIASTCKDEAGNLVTKEYKVEGPVMLFLTTTAIDIDEELVNRCLVLSVNEGREQTEAIHSAQRYKRTLSGLENNLQKEYAITLHKNAQRLLKSYKVINSYADQLTFVSHKTRTRRDNEKYLTLIDSIALLHQYQRQVKAVNHQGKRVEYIEVTLEDIEIANRLASEVLGRTLDELPPQTRKLLTMINDWVEMECLQHSIEQKDYRFNRRKIRELCGWSETQVRVHVKRLVDMEYLLVHSGGRGQSFEYELLYNGSGDESDTFLHGLLDVKKLKKVKVANKTNSTMPASRGGSPKFAGSTRPQRGGVADSEKPPQLTNGKVYSETSRNDHEKPSPVM